MSFLLTNDDGIAAPGLWAATRELAGSDAWAIANGYVSLTRLRLLRDAGHETAAWRDAQLPQPMPVFTAGIGLNAAPSPNSA
jgi:broad specificity polyphosphatase/5'/3'-nucleotidase SurE